MFAIRLLSPVLGRDRAHHLVVAYAYMAGSTLHRAFLLLFRLELALSRLVRRGRTARSGVIDRHMRYFIFATRLLLPILD